MIGKYSQEDYSNILNELSKKLENNDMLIVDISVAGTNKTISNTYITYKCKKCGSVSKPSAVSYLLRRICKCPKQCHNLKWDYASCFETAKKCNYQAEFRRKFSGAFSAAWENRWMNDYTWFKQPSRKSSKWDYQSTFKEAQKYNSRYAFSLGSSGAYTVANNNNWLDDYTWFKKSYQDVQHSDIINKIYKRIEEFPYIYFDEAEFSHYKAGRNRKIPLHCKKHPDEVITRNLRAFLYGRVPNISYCKKCVDDEKLKYKDFDEMIEQLKQYKTLNEARKNDVCLIEHLRKTEEGRRYVDTLERGKSAWKRGIYSYEFNIFDKKYVYVGLTCNFKNRDKDHRHIKSSSVYKFSVTHNLKIPKMKKETEYLDWELARNKESEYMTMYQKRGYILINKRPGGGLGSVNFNDLYTIEEAIEDVRKNNYKNINELSHKNWALYNQIMHHISAGDEAWNDLLPKATRNEPNYWTRERVKEVFAKYETVAAINKNGYGAAYRAYLRWYRKDEELNKIVKKTNTKYSKRIGMFDDFGNLIKVFSSRYEVDPELIGYSTLSRAISSNKKARGYYWRYTS